MTRYEELMRKANRCLTAAKNTEGRMREIWKAHYYAIKEKIEKMSVKELSAQV